jgi:AcrR family transcriptional regulator
MLLMFTSDGKTSRNYHHGDLRRALIRGGRDLLRESGVEAVTVRAAAARAGVSVSAPYRHFADKQALLSAILVDGLHSLNSDLAADDTGDAMACLRTLGHRFVDVILADPDLFRLLSAIDTSTGGDPEVAEAEQAAFASFAELIAAAAAEGAIEVESVEATVLTMRCVMQGLASMIVAKQIPAEDAHQAADQVMNVVDQGLLPRK